MSEDKQAIADLIARAASDQRHVAVAAIRELRDRGALGDGSLQGVDLSGASLSGADLRDADLRGADLRGANLSRADLSGADLRGADLRGADLTDARLLGAVLDASTQMDARWRLVWEIVNEGASGRDLRGARLSGAGLRRADLSKADLRNADLRRANLSYADLSGADLGGADLSEATLSRADLSGARLGGARMRGARLYGADLRRADLRRADLRGAGLDGARLSGARLRGAEVTDEQLGQARPRVPREEKRPRGTRPPQRPPEVSLPPMRDDALTSSSGGHGAPPPGWPRWQAPAPQGTFRSGKIPAPKELLSKISVAHPRLLSKRFASKFAVHVYWSDELEEVNRDLRKMFGEGEFARKVEYAHLLLGSVIEMELQSPEIEFSGPVVRQLHEPVTRFLFLGKPKDGCRTGKEHTVLLSVRHAETGRELESILFDVQVVDYAFDHVSHPLLSRVAAGLSGMGAVVVFILTLLQHVDTTVGVTSGAAIAIFAGAIYARFLDLFRRLESTTTTP